VRIPRRANGLLGAELERAGDGAYLVKRIYRGAAPDRVVSPLDVPGVDVDEGDYILAVNGRPVTDERPFLALLENLAGKDVVLTVADAPDADETREAVVHTIGNEGELKYAEWVRKNREYVLEKTGGKMGYIHVPDMMGRGMIEFNTWFYPQLAKEGMVVDMRWNGGGSYSQIMVERLRREIVSFTWRRGGGVTHYPRKVMNGPFVVLVNEGSGSDGDIFPQAIQIQGLAPIIGSRTWGGVNGISGLRPLVDGGLVTQSQIAWWDRKDGWGLENRGVIPDVEVKSLPQDVARGVDVQMDRGIAELMKMHASDPPQKPDFGPIMKRARKAYRSELRD
jgi:tricorn protease